MEYTTRLRLITSLLNDWLRQFRQPEHLTQEASLLVLRSTAEAMNARISASCDQDALTDRVGDAFREVRSTYKGRDWPTAAHLVEALGKLQSPVTAGTNDEPSLDPLEIAAKRIKAREPVGDGWIYGRRCLELLASGKVTDDEIQKCRSAFFFGMREIYGDEQARAMESAYIERHRAAASIAGEAGK